MDGCVSTYLPHASPLPRSVGDLNRWQLLKPIPDVPGLEIAASFRPFGRASGDLFDFFPLDDNPITSRWCAFIADASGHGVTAAVAVSQFNQILRAHPPCVGGPADLLCHVNRQLCRRKSRGFVTAFLGVYDPNTRRLCYTCAGHPRPLAHTCAQGRICCLDCLASFPVGIELDQELVEAEFHILPGDTILLYTDGITEARDPGNEMFGDERLHLSFAQCRKSPACLIEHIERNLAAHRKGRAPTDDQTLVVVSGV
jgi:sigma-B regulation protein RsbU (phosphoserine phosphatase)